MALVVGDIVLVKDSVGSKGSPSVVGDEIAVNSGLGTKGINYVVGDEIVIWDKALGIKSGGEVTKIPDAEKFYSPYSGCGDWAWELISVYATSASENLKAYWVKRSTNSASLDVASIDNFLTATATEITYYAPQGLYYWVKPIFGVSESLGANSIYLLSDDQTHYIMNIVSNSQHIIYNFDPSTGAISQLVSYNPGTYGFVLWYENGYFYSYGRNNEAIYKIRASDFTIVASSPSATYAWSQIIITQNYIYALYTLMVPPYTQTFRQLNKSDLSYTGVHGSTSFTYVTAYFLISNGVDMGWVTGNLNIIISPEGKYTVPGDVYTPNIPVESAFE